MNNINITGNIVAKPIIRGAEDKKVASFTVAVRGRNEHTDFIRCTAFGKTAEYLERNADKGNKVAVTGSLHIDSYEKDGNKIPTAEVYVRNVELMTRKASETANTEATEPEVAPASDDFVVLDDEDNELPFN